MIHDALHNISNEINIVSIALLLCLMFLILFLFQLYITKKLNACLIAQKSSSSLLADIHHSLASSPTLDEYISHVSEKLEAELESILRVNTGQTGLLLKNLNEIQTLIEDLSHEVITREIARHELNKLISASLKD